MCKLHHRDIHHNQWAVQIVDGRVLVTRPAWAEPGHSGQPWYGRRRPWPRRSGAGVQGGLEPRGDPPGPGAGDGDRHGSRSPAEGWSPGEGRVWPWANDPPPLTTEEAIALAPWGANPDDNLPPPRREPAEPPAWVSPWGDDPEDNVPPVRREPVEPSTWVSPWGDDEDAPETVRTEDLAAPSCTPA